MTIAAYGKHTERPPHCPHCGGVVPAKKHGLTFYADSGIVVRNGKRAKLTHSELMVLECFIDAYPRLVSKDHILDTLYGSHDAPLSNVHRVMITHLRQKLGHLGVNFINDVGFGWRMNVDTALREV